VSVKVFSKAYLDELVHLACASPRRRQHRNIHKEYGDPCQRFFNAIEPDSYLRPHRHASGQGPETMIAIRGFMALLIFDQAGQIAEVHPFGSGHHHEQGSAAAGVETPPDRWHTVLSLEPGSVLLEIKAGPFDAGVPKFPAPWAPEEHAPEAQEYLAGLFAAIRGRATMMA
jgi:cupin fold WbuC family metalloprotein